MIDRTLFEAIETLVYGVWYRSKLEAYWSVWLGHCRLKELVYEPTECHMNYWVPDFYLMQIEVYLRGIGDLNFVPVYAEVKPIVWEGTNTEDRVKQIRAEPELKKVLRNSGHWRYVLGSRPTETLIGMAISPEDTFHAIRPYGGLEPGITWEDACAVVNRELSCPQMTREDWMLMAGSLMRGDPEFALAYFEYHLARS